MQTEVPTDLSKETLTIINETPSIDSLVDSVLFTKDKAYRVGTDKEKDLKIASFKDIYKSIFTYDDWIQYDATYGAKEEFGKTFVRFFKYLLTNEYVEFDLDERIQSRLNNVLPLETICEIVDTNFETSDLNVVAMSQYLVSDIISRVRSISKKLNEHDEEEFEVFLSFVIKACEKISLRALRKAFDKHVDDKLDEPLKVGDIEYISKWLNVNIIVLNNGTLPEDVDVGHKNIFLNLEDGVFSPLGLVDQKTGKPKWVFSDDAKIFLDIV